MATMTASSALVPTVKAYFYRPELDVVRFLHFLRYSFLTPLLPTWPFSTKSRAPMDRPHSAGGRPRWHIWRRSVLCFKRVLDH